MKASIEEQERTLLFHANFLESSFEDIRGWFDFLDFLQTLNHGGQLTRESFRLSINFKKKVSYGFVLSSQFSYWSKWIDGRLETMEALKQKIRHFVPRPPTVVLSAA